MKAAGTPTSFQGRSSVSESGPQQALGEAFGVAVALGGCSRALWLSQNEHYYFHKSSHFHAHFPWYLDLCNYGKRMCGKASLENASLLFVKRLT